MWAELVTLKGNRQDRSEDHVPPFSLTEKSITWKKSCHLPASFSKDFISLFLYWFLATSHDFTLKELIYLEKSSVSGAYCCFNAYCHLLNFSVSSTCLLDWNCSASTQDPFWDSFLKGAPGFNTPHYTTYVILMMVVQILLFLPERCSTVSHT